MDRKPVITVTVCAFSGRRNPQWTITEQDYHKLLLLAERCPPAHPQEHPALLGYTGIVVTGGEKRIHVFRHIITITDDRQVLGYADRDGVMERKLLHTGPVAIVQEIKGFLPEELY